MFCTKCGKQSLDDAGQFCAYCGSMLVNETTAKNSYASAGNLKSSKDYPQGVLWSIIFLCTRSVMWAIASVMFIAHYPAVSTWNIIWTIFGFYVIYQLFKRNIVWYKRALWLAGVDAIWLLYQYISSNVHELFLYIFIIDIIAFIFLIVNKKHFIIVSK